VGPRAVLDAVMKERFLPLHFKAQTSHPYRSYGLAKILLPVESVFGLNILFRFPEFMKINLPSMLHFFGLRKKFCTRNV
jgi:hypothetical protein